MGALHVSIKRATALAHPTDEFRGDARDQAVRRDILCDDGAGSNHRTPADCDAAKNCGVRPDRSFVLDLRRDNLPVGAHRPRINVVRETNVRSNENTVCNFYAPIEGREVLDFAIVANGDPDIDVHVLPDGTMATDSRSFSNLGPMPNMCLVSNRRLSGDVRGGVNPSDHSFRDPAFPFSLRNLPEHPTATENQVSNAKITDNI